LYVGAKGVELIRSKTRLQALFFWDFVTYVIEGAIFLLTGLQARVVIDALEATPWNQLSFYALAISAVAIIVRFIWVFPAIYLPPLLSARLRQRDPAPPWQHSFVIAFTGVRGVVSLAAALSIPLIAGDLPFPDRSLILFLTFSVIIVTLVLQGPTLPWLVARLGLVDSGSREAQAREQLEAQARVGAAQAALERLDGLAAASHLPPEQTRRLRELQLDRVNGLERRRDRESDDIKIATGLDRIELALIQVERDYINGLLRDGRIGDEIRRRIERDLDLREEGIHRSGTAADEA
jgi:CPA1 family monovalent cation:H+ antiporter